MNAVGTAAEQLQYFFSQVVEERAGIPKSQAREDSYTLCGSPRYATAVGCAGSTGERLEQMVAVAPVHR